MALTLEYSSAFKRDLKKSKKRGNDLTKLQKVLDMLANNQPLPMRYRNHQLSGNWVGYSECHVTPDWLLIYKIVDNTLYVARTGSHSDLF